MKIKVIIEKEFDIVNNISISNPVKVRKDFKGKAIGKATVTKQDNELIAEMEVSEQYLDLYPAIGFQYKPTEQNKYNEVKLYEVSICEMRNVDETIKTIRGQVKLFKTLK